MKPAILFYSDFPFGYHNPEAETKMERFAARGYPVTYIEQLGIRNPGPGKLLEAVRRLRSLPVASGAHHGMKVISPKLLPPRRAPVIDRLNRAWLRHQLLSPSTEPRRTILWARFPTPELVALAESEPFRLVAYELVDDHEHGPGMTPRLQRLFRDAERRLLERAQVVFAWSEPLRARLAERHSNVQLASAAVDLEPFTAVSGPELIVPCTAVYAGSLDFRVDAELLATAAGRLPDWRFVVAGPISAQVERTLRELPNLHALGPVPRGEIPAIIGQAAVCLMPYRVNDYSDNLFPVKLVEYLAAGRPVVSTAIRAARDLDPVVTVAAGHEAFADALRRAAEEDSPERARKRMSIAAKYSWEGRIDAMEAAIQKALGDA